MRTRKRSLFVALAVALAATAMSPTPASAQSAGGPQAARWGPNPPPPTVRQQIQLGGHIGIPSFFTDNRHVTSTGFQAEAHLGLDLGYIVPLLRIGWQWHDVNIDPRYQDSLERFWFAIGARLEGHNDTIVTPFLEGAVDFNWWSLSFEQDVVCGTYYCYTTAVYHFAPGVSGRLGLQIEVGQYQQAAIELGGELGMSFPGDVFVGDQAWIGPFFGVTGFFY